ncbi:MAG: hypothetical protein SFW63_08590 [Alphaproteobacteria bacterium]|nr:hypothetical protein [Alphaproteobacteria bacterium]
MVGDFTIGAAMGVLGAIFNQSATGNIASSAGASLLASAVAVWPFKVQDKFFSSNTALTAINVTVGSALAHLVTDALIHKHHKQPTIVLSPHCEHAEKSWVAKTSQASDQLEMGR